MWPRPVVSRAPRLSAGAARGILDILDATYRLDQSPTSWLSGVLAAARPMLERGGGIEAYFVDCSEGFAAEGHVRLGVESHDLWRDWMEHVPVDVRRAVHTFAPAGYSATLPLDAELAQAWASRRGVGLMGVNAIDASLRGVTLVAHDGARARKPPSASELERWTYLSSHIAAGARLVRRQQAAPVPEAVLDVEGRVLHADGAARAAEARQALRRAAIEMDRVRSRRRRDRDDVLEHWRALVEGRWTLLDVFEENGRRYVVARPNAPASPAIAALSPRERQVASAASLGHANKLIAYELGVAESTVATVLRRAARKLGASSRAELIRLVRGDAS